MGTRAGKDVHSSLMARVDNPAWRLVKALDTLVADDGFTPAIEGWFDSVAPLTDRQKQLIAEDVAKSDEAQMKKILGVKRWIKDEDFLTSSIRLASQPTVNIQGLVSGYTGPGGKTVLPGRAEAKLDFRLVPNMTKDEAVEAQGASREARLSDIEVRQRRLQPDRDRRRQRRSSRAAQATLQRAGIPYTTCTRAGPAAGRA